MKARELNIDTARGRDGETAIEYNAEPLGIVSREGSMRPKSDNPLCALTVSVPFRRLAVSPPRRLESQGSQ
jgi:hypothetical protein